MALTKRIKTSLKVGDSVMVIAGGSGEKRNNKGKIGKILKFVGKDRVLVEGINFIARHQKARSANEPTQRVVKEGPIHISNVMYYADKAARPVRLCKKILADGTKVRGYIDRESKEFVQI
ncbi:MAG: 50S ribosomal protein L24 [Bdellovibrionota bacterium]